MKSEIYYPALFKCNPLLNPVKTGCHGPEGVPILIFWLPRPSAAGSPFPGPSPSLGRGMSEAGAAPGAPWLLCSWMGALASRPGPVALWTASMAYGPKGSRRSALPWPCLQPRPAGAGGKRQCVSMTFFKI